MLYEANHTHQASQRPLLLTEGEAMLKQLFTEQNMKNSDVNLVAAYIELSARYLSGPIKFFSLWTPKTPKQLEDFSSKWLWK